MCLHKKKMSESDTTQEDNSDECMNSGCDGDGKWIWWNGKGGFGPYCDSCAREQLSDTDRCPITRREDVSGVYVISAGIQPQGTQFPTIRTKSAFDTYRESDGERPRQCEVGFCSQIRSECNHDGKVGSEAN